MKVLTLVLSAVSLAVAGVLLALSIVNLVHRDV